MCDLKNICGILVGVSALMIGAIVACGVAIGLNLGIITAGGAPIAFGITLALSLAANIGLLPVIILVRECISGACKAPATDVLAWLVGAAATLALGITGAYIALVTSGFPVAGAVAMGAVASCLVIASVGILKAVASLRKLPNCSGQPAPATLQTVFILSVVAVAASVFGIIFYGLFSIGTGD